MGSNSDKIGLMDDEMSVDELDADETMTKDGWSESEADEAVDGEKTGGEETSTVESEDEDEDWTPSIEENSPASKRELEARTPRAAPTVPSQSASRSRHSEQLSSIRERMQMLRLDRQMEDEEDDDDVGVAKMDLAEIPTPKKSAAGGSSRRSTK